MPSIETLKAWLKEDPDNPIETDELEAESVETAHRGWLKRCEGKKVEHPLAQAIKTWCEIVTLNDKPTGILPEPFRDAVPVGEATSRAIVPLLPLRFGRARTHEPNRGAPLAKRIWWAAIANTPISERKRDGSALLRTTLRNVGAWLYPDGRGLRRRELPRLNEALEEVNKFLIDWNGESLQCVRVKARPTEHTPLDDPLPFRVRLPFTPEGYYEREQRSNRGPLIELKILYRCGTVSEPVFDMWIRLAYMWDMAKRNNGRRRVYATRPEVQRDKHGRLIDAKGELITGPDPAPPASWRHPAGRRRQRKQAGNRILSWRDSRADLIGKEEVSPAIKRVAVLKRTDIHRLLFGAEPVTPEKVKAARRIIDRQFNASRRIIDGQLKEPSDPPTRNGSDPPNKGKKVAFSLSRYVVIEQVEREGLRILLERPKESDQ